LCCEKHALFPNAPDASHRLAKDFNVAEYYPRPGCPNQIANWLNIGDIDQMLRLSGCDYKISASPQALAEIVIDQDNCVDCIWRTGVCPTEAL